jgi:uncharacterized protein HemY
MKQSSIEWLIRELDLDNASPTMKAINHARAMHKEEMEHFFKMGMSLVEGRLWKPIDKFDEAYNETYKGNK